MVTKSYVDVRLVCKCGNWKTVRDSSVGNVYNPVCEIVVTRNICLKCGKDMDIKVFKITETRTGEEVK